LPDALSAGDSPGGSEADTSWIDPSALLDAILEGALAGEECEPEILEEAERLLREAAAMRARPVDVNGATLAALLRVPWIDVPTAIRILAFRRERGLVRSVDELADGAGVDAATLERIRPYLTAAPRRAGHVIGRAGPAEPLAPGPGETRALLSSVRLRSSATVGGAGPESCRWPGPAVGAFVRVRGAPGANVTVGAAFERDPGETALADHAAFHVTWRAAEDRDGLPGIRVVAGDLRVRWGQGLVAGGGGFGAASSYPLPSDRGSGYDGASESGVRRGVLVRIERGRARASLLAARTRLDATLDRGGLVTSIRSSGYHRTEGERAAVGALTERALGARIAFAIRSGIELAATGLRVAYDPAFAPRDPLRDRFGFCGSGIDLFGADFRMSLGAWRCAAEVASGSNGGGACIVAGAARLGAARVRIGWAHADPEYEAPLGGALPGVSGGSNGNSVWIQGAVDLGRRLDVRASARARTQPWRGYAAELPEPSFRGAIGLDLDIARAGRVSVDLTEVRSLEEDGEPVATTSRTDRSSAATFAIAGDPRVTLFAKTRTAASAGAEIGRVAVAGARVEVAIGEAFELSAGAAGVTKRGSVRPVVVPEPRLSGEFGLRSLNVSGTRWYIRVRGGLPAGIGAALRLGGGAGTSGVELGLGFDFAGGAVPPPLSPRDR